MYRLLVLYINKLFKRKQIMDATFVNTVSNQLTGGINHFFPGSKFTITPSTVFNGQSGIFVFNIVNPSNLKTSQNCTIEIKVYKMSSQNLLYFEMINCNIIYFPYLARLWNMLETNRYFIVHEWNSAALRNGLLNTHSVVAYY